MQKSLWKILVVLFTIGLLLALPNFIFAFQNSVTISNNLVQMELTIHEAFYTDADNDGYQDDIISYFSVSVSVINSDDDLDDDADHEDLDDDADHEDLDDDADHEDKKLDNFKIEIKLDVTITLPSNKYYEYSFVLKLKTGINNFKLTLLNHAVELGWYDLLMTMKIRKGGQINGTALLTFDPPGTGGGDPVGKVEDTDD